MTQNEIKDAMEVQSSMEVQSRKLQKKLGERMLKGRGKILAGPGKHDLQLALFEGKEAHFRVEFHGRKQTIRVNIVAVEAEDGSRESWNIQGHIRLSEPLSRKRFNAYFQTRQRTGFLEITDY